MNSLKFTLVILILGGFLNIVSAQTCHPGDFSSLMILRNATNGGGGIGSWNGVTTLGLGNTWDGNIANVSEWYGIDTIHVGAFYRISKIDLNGNGFIDLKRLENTIPGSLFDGAAFEYLDSLILSNNKLTGTAANIKFATPVTNHLLKFLDLDNNEFVSATASNMFSHLFADLDNLEEVRMDSVMLAVAPTTFSTFNFTLASKLTKIHLEHNKFTGVLSLGALLDTQWPGLLTMYIGNNLLTSIDAPAVNNGGTLVSLNIPFNNVTNPLNIADCLENLDSLQQFNGASVMNEGLLTALVVNGSTFAPNLKWIDLPSNGFTSLIPVEIFEDIPNLEYLELTDNNLFGTLPAPRDSFSAPPFNGVFAYQGLSKLKFLGLNLNNLQGALHLDWLFLSQLNANLPAGAMTAPLETFGVGSNHFNTVTPDLSQNHIAHVLSILSNRFNNLQNINVEQNAFKFKDLFRIKRFFRFKQIGLVQDHYVPQGELGLNVNSFKYHPQDSLGIGGIKRRNPGDSLILAAGPGMIEPEQGGLINVIRNRYVWKRVGLGGFAINIGTHDHHGGGFFAGPGAHSSFNTGLGAGSDSTTSHQMSITQLQSDSLHHNRHFTACITNDSFPRLELCMKRKKIEVGDCTDNSGRPVQCQTMIVQFDPDTLAQYSVNQQDSLKDASAEAMGATPIATCVCGDLELWEISDTATTMLEGFGKGTSQSTTTASARPELLSAEENYSLMDSTGGPLPDTVALPSGSGNTTSTTLVAIIDSGMDYDYTGLVPHISEGASLTTSCMQDAVWGYNFLDSTNNASDDQGHGTAIAGIVTGMSQQNLLPDTGSIAGSIGILPLKYTNKNGEGTIFNAACALYYAADYARTTAGGQTATVRVINCSWGYYGDPSDILENTINYASEDCDVLVIASAGNDSILVEGADSLRHWPSGAPYDSLGNSLTYDNILSVAAVDNHTGNTLSAYSNYGPTSIDIAAQGDDNTTQAGSTSSFVSVRGTSFATAQVSRAAALLFDKYPDATYWAVKYALVNGVDILQSSDSTKINSGGRLNYTKADSILNSLVDRTICSDYTSILNTEAISNIDYHVLIYPNPVSNNLTIEIDPLIQTNSTQISLFNVQGLLLEYKELETGVYHSQLSTQHLPAGVYFLQLQLDGKQISKKIIKN